MKKQIFLFLILFTNSVFPQELSQQEISDILKSNQSNITNSKDNSDVIEKQNLTNLQDESLLEQENKLIDDEDQEEKRIYEKFGFDYFNNQKIVASSPSLLDIPVDANYSIGYNDELELMLIGGIDSLYNLRVDLSGDILIPGIGKINLSNLNLEQANSKIQLAVNQNYIGTTSYLSVTNASLKKISIIGEVLNPGSYIVNPFTSVSEAIKYAGGLKDNASLRSVVLRRSNGSQLDIDLYDMLIGGDRNADVSLRSGDTIVIKATMNFVKIDGGVFRPKTYEYKQTDSYKDLFVFAQGLKQRVSNSRLSVNYKLDNKIITKEIDQNEFVGDKEINEIFVGSDPISFDLSLKINGSEVSNGFYDYSLNESLKTALSDLDFTKNNFPYFAILVQESLNGNKEVNFFSLFDQETMESLTLAKNPEVYFFSREEINFLSENFLDNLTYLPQTELNLLKDQILEEISEQSLSIKYLVNYLLLEGLKR